MRTDTQPPAPPKRPSRVRRLTNRVRASRRRTRLATGAAVLATVFALRPQPAPPPEPIPLGKGQAGVRAVAATPPVADEAAVPLAPAEGAVADQSDEPTAGPVGQPIQGGEASYYGDELAGNPTASGEPFRPEALTAAHRTLPLGSRIRVTNLRTDESVIVRVNDRGPFAEHRVLDLSKAAAREIGMLRRGTAKVRMELLPKRTRG